MFFQALKFNFHRLERCVIKPVFVFTRTKIKYPSAAILHNNRQLVIVSADIELIHTVKTIEKKDHELAWQLVGDFKRPSRLRKSALKSLEHAGMRESQGMKDV